jgi:hypothetical protein
MQIIIIIYTYIYIYIHIVLLRGFCYHKPNAPTPPTPCPPQPAPPPACPLRPFAIFTPRASPHLARAPALRASPPFGLGSNSFGLPSLLLRLQLSRPRLGSGSALLHPQLARSPPPSPWIAQLPTGSASALDCSAPNWVGLPSFAIHTNWRGLFLDCSSPNWLGFPSFPDWLAPPLHPPECPQLPSLSAPPLPPVSSAPNSLSLLVR